MSDHAQEVLEGERFAFGENWEKFLGTLSDAQIHEAEMALKNMLGVVDLRGLSFLDIGSGSGVHSLAASRLGARVHSFDFDQQSVACTQKLREQHGVDVGRWRIEQGSVLDADYVRQLGRFDIVYSWGVLHHTGQMWPAIANAAKCVAPGGLFFIALYNDQGRASKTWLRIKRAYNALPVPLRWLVLWPSFARLWGPTSLRDLLAGQPGRTWRSYASNRGMTPWRDVVDWVGGLPFEVAKPEQVIDFLTPSGFMLKRMITCAGGHGCNEYVFARERTMGSEAH